MLSSLNLANLGRAGTSNAVVKHGPSAALRRGANLGYTCRLVDCDVTDDGTPIFFGGGGHGSVLWLGGEGDRRKTGGAGTS